jgi:putative aldouronate transport system permease protein
MAMKQRPDTILVLSYTALVLFSAICLLPFVAMVSISVSREAAVLDQGYRLLPVGYTLAAYRTLFTNADAILNGYLVSVVVTSFGSVLSTVFMATCAYALAHRHFRHTSVISFLIYFTMLFSGGLVPTYIVISNLYRMSNTLYALILPVLVVPYFVFMLRAYVRGVSFEIVESATMDGAGEITICFRIVFPMIVPALAAVFLLRIFFYWNDWFQAMLYVPSRSELWPIQYWMQQVMRNVSFIVQNMSRSGILQQHIVTRDMPVESLRMAMAVVAAGPVVLIFLFLQRYLVRGITLGAVKG